MTTTLMLMSFEHLSQSVNQSTKSSPTLRFLIEGFQIHFNHAMLLIRERERVNKEHGPSI